MVPGEGWWLQAFDEWSLQFIIMARAADAHANIFIPKFSDTSVTCERKGYGKGRVFELSKTLALLIRKIGSLIAFS